LRIGNVGESKLNMAQYLARPWDRLDEYIAILKDFLRYTAKATQSTTKLERAIEMLLDLRKQADDQSSLDHIVGYIGDLKELGPVYRHVNELYSLLQSLTVFVGLFIITT